MDDKTKIFAKMPVSRAVLTLAIPTIISQLITVVYNMADTYFIGQLNDPAQVAGAVVCVPAFLALTAFANLFGIGGASKISRSLGQGDLETAKKSASFSIWSAVAVGLVYGFIMLFARPVVLPLLGARPDTMGASSDYLFWTVTIGAIPTVLNTCLAHLVRSEGYAKQSAFGIAMGGVLNILLDPIFIFLLDLEIAGAAMATMISNCCSVAFFVIFIYRIRKTTVITASPKYFTLKEGIPSEIIVGGIPSCIGMLLGCVSNAILNNLVTAASTEAMAGMGIAKKIDTVAFAVAQGMTQGTLPLIAYNYASGNRKRMNDSIKTTLTYALSLAVVSMVVLYFFAGPITAAFIDDAKTVEYGKMFLQVICFICPSTTINFMITTVFQATKQKVQPIVLSILRKGTLDIPLMLILGKFWGLKGIANAIPISDWLACAMAFAMFIPFYRRMKREEKQ